MEAISQRTVRRRVAAGSTAKDIFYHLVCRIRLAAWSDTHALPGFAQMDEEGHERVRPAIELCVVDGETTIGVRIILFSFSNEHLLTLITRPDQTPLRLPWAIFGTCYYEIPHVSTDFGRKWMKRSLPTSTPAQTSLNKPQCPF